MMMELSHSLTLNEEALQQIPADKRALFVFEWLRFLDKVLVAAQKSDIKGCQQKLVGQLMGLVREGEALGCTGERPCGLGPPARLLLARCLATLFSVGDTFLLFDTVNKCNDVLKSKDDSPAYLPTRLAAVCCVGSMYEKLGRMMGRSYEETVQILIRSLRSAESQTRIEIMHTLEKVSRGMGNAISNVHRDMSKAARGALTDRCMGVRCAAAGCLLGLLEHAPQLYTTEVDSLAALCFRAFDGSTYQVRCSVAELLGRLLAKTQNADAPVKGANTSTLQAGKGGKAVGGPGMSLEEALNILMSGFLRGGSSFLKGEIIKAGSGVNREVRVGVTHAYLVFLLALGGPWLERNLETVISHVLELVASPKAASSHVDAVYSRKCVNYILRGALGRLLGEKAQAQACREITRLIAERMQAMDFSPENAKDCNQETLFSQHFLVCGLVELGELAVGLGTSAQALLSDRGLDLIGAVTSVLLHPCHAARLAAAWCLRCLCTASPQNITPLIDRCVDGIDNMRTSPEAISGYSCALAAVLGAARASPLGVPHNRGKVVFNTAEELLRSASQNSRLSLNRTHAGWLLIGAIMTLGVPVVRGLLPRMLLLWRNSFPRSNKELESEKARGDAFTWQVCLEGRAGALSALSSLLEHCPSLATDDVTRRLTQPVESALAMLTNIASVLRAHGQRVKAAAALVRLRLYVCLSRLCCWGEAVHAPLLRALVAELALADSAAHTATCLARDQDLQSLGLLGDADAHHAEIEDQLLSGLWASGAGALEHDPCCLYRTLSPGARVPGPAPLGVAVIDAAVLLFGLIFPRVANKHRLQMLDHFAECIRLAKSTRQEAIQINVYAALLGGLRGLTESKAGLGAEDVRKSATNLIMGGLSCPSAVVRCLAGQALGRLAPALPDTVGGGPGSLGERLGRQLLAGRTAPQRTGACMALGALHRARGGMAGGGGNTHAAPVLLALAKDNTSTEVQVWSLHALALLADAGGPMFRGLVEPALSTALSLLLSVPPEQEHVHRRIAKLLAALITARGPELQGNTASICTSRSMFLCACAVMQEVGAPAVRAEAIGCLQQLHLFAPRHLNLTALVPQLCRNLWSDRPVLRRAAIACLRQLSQREAKEVCQHALLLQEEPQQLPGEVVMSESGLPGVLFAMLDVETDRQVVQHLQDTLTSMLQALASSQLQQWLSLCKAVLTTKLESEEGGGAGGLDADDADDNDQEEFHADEQLDTHPPIQPRWPTRVFAMESVQRIMSVCEAAGEAHFDLLLAKEQQLTKNNVDFLVLHLADLIRMSFMAATSEADPLRLQGLRTLHSLIVLFRRSPEPELPGQLLLEQFQAQVGAALRPAFSPDTPAHLTAQACHVCSAWIGSGVARDLNDLKRVHQLLVSSLHKLNTKLTAGAQIYNESMATLEKLAILKAWAEIYIVAMRSDTSNSDGCVLSLVRPELASLSVSWVCALRDHALLGLPPEFGSQLPHEGGAFYTADTVEGARPHYLQAWPTLLHAAALHFATNTLPEESDNCNEVKESVTLELTTADDADVAGDTDNTNNNDKSPLDSQEDKFHLLFGICIEALCSCRETCEGAAESCLRALAALLHTPCNRGRLLKDRCLCLELCRVLHRTGLTQEGAPALLLTAQVLGLTITAAQEDLDSRTHDLLKDAPADRLEELSLSTCVSEGEGGETGALVQGSSLVFSCLEVSLCLLVRALPALSPAAAATPRTCTRQDKEEEDELIQQIMACLARLPALASPQGAVGVLPSILHLCCGVLRECGGAGSVREQAVSAALSTLQAVCVVQPHASHPSCSEQWGSLLQSTLSQVIHLAKSDECVVRLDVVVSLRAMSALLPHAPPTQLLHFPCINHFRMCLQSEDPKVVCACAGLLSEVWGLGAGWARALAPPLLQRLLASRPSAELPMADLKQQQQLAAAQACLTAAEALLPHTPQQTRVQMLWVVVPVVMWLLQEPGALPHCPALSRDLHALALQWLMRTAPRHPQEFKALMAQSQELRTRLQGAVKAQQMMQPQQAATNRQRSGTSNKQSSKPTIQLKTDFSNFS